MKWYAAQSFHFDCSDMVFNTYIIPCHPFFFTLFDILGQKKEFWQFFNFFFLPESGICSFRSPRMSHSSLPAVKRCDNTVYSFSLTILQLTTYNLHVCHLCYFFIFIVQRQGSVITTKEDFLFRVTSPLAYHFTCSYTIYI